VIKLLVIYASKTGNVKRFVGKLNDIRLVNLADIQGKVNEPYVIITYTAGFGKVPNKVEEFLSENSSYLRGVASSGNRNWGSNFCKSAEIISKRYDVPIILKFELSGTKKDVVKFEEAYKDLVLHQETTRE
jgi:protein involved in ribonucleotide reduction